VALSALSLFSAHETRAQEAKPSAPASAACPPEMAKVGGYCIDRFEVTTVDHKTGKALSPFYPPAPVQLRFIHEYWSVEAGRMGDARVRLVPLPPVPEVEQSTSFSPRAVSRAGAVPQGYLSYYSARTACENAGKRLCTEDEWVHACRGPGRRLHPYGEQFVQGACNVNRLQHPAFVLHGNSSLGHLDPRLNLVFEQDAGPLLRETGTSPRCISPWDAPGVYDMEGNLDEWIEDPEGTFVGGFYSRGTTQGCEARVSSHAPAYYDYSLGTRCCKSAR
jgi:formylglycine-generating enzyme required for sulfatase activity